MFNIIILINYFNLAYFIVFTNEIVISGIVIFEKILTTNFIIFLIVIDVLIIIVIIN